MRVLIGCEESGTMRDAFAALGHDAWSNDLKAARYGGAHYQCDVFDAIDDGPWDLIILHPECTCMCVSGNRTYGAGKPKAALRAAAIVWTCKLWDYAKKRARKGVALENPASVIFPRLNASVQYVQPWQFGHPEQKKTGFALDRLPKLVETQNVYPQMMLLPVAQRERIHHMAPSPQRSMIRSTTFSGIAAACAAQWGCV